MATEAQILERINQALETERAARVSTVSVKLPPFWPDKTNLWFVQVEGQFTIKNITTEKTKYAYLVTMLDSQTATQVMDTLQAPGETPYTALKNHLMKVFAITDGEKATKIIDMVIKPQANA